MAVFRPTELYSGKIIQKSFRCFMAGEQFAFQWDSAFLYAERKPRPETFIFLIQ